MYLCPHQQEEQEEEQEEEARETPEEETKRHRRVHALCENALTLLHTHMVAWKEQKKLLRWLCRRLADSGVRKQLDDVMALASEGSDMRVLARSVATLIEP